MKMMVISVTVLSSRWLRKVSETTCCLCVRGTGLFGEFFSMRTFLRRHVGSYCFAPSLSEYVGTGSVHSKLSADICDLFVESAQNKA